MNTALRLYSTRYLFTRPAGSPAQTLRSWKNSSSSNQPTLPWTRTATWFTWRKVNGFSIRKEAITPILNFILLRRYTNRRGGGGRKRVEEEGRGRGWRKRVV